MSRWIRVTIVGLFIMMMCICGGCSVLTNITSHTKDDLTIGTTGYQIYYINRDNTGIVAKGYQFKATTEEGIIEEAIQVLLSDTEEKDYHAAIMEPVAIERYEYDKEAKQLNIYMNEHYQSQSNAMQMLIQAAVVKTTAQFSGIVENVSFNVAGSWLMDSEGEIMKMKDSDYVVDFMQKQEVIH